MRIARCIVVLSLATAACASRPTARWQKEGGTDSGFDADNERCGAVSSRMAPTARPDQPPAGNVAPRNRMDAPPRVDANPVRQRAYMDCMSDRGWRVVQP
jgi:hypothetical protein